MNNIFGGTVNLSTIDDVVEACGGVAHDLNPDRCVLMSDALACRAFVRHMIGRVANEGPLAQAFSCEHSINSVIMRIHPAGDVVKIHVRACTPENVTLSSSEWMYVKP